MAKPQPKPQLQPVSRIPEFSSIAEEAEFWDTHDITDFLDELSPVKIEYAGSISDSLVVTLDRGEQVALNQLAEEQGISSASLVHLWIKEHLSKKTA